MNTLPSIIARGSASAVLWEESDFTGSNESKPSGGLSLCPQDSPQS